MQPRKVIAHIVTWLNTYLEKSGLAGFCVGVSGGIDSAVTATLCAETGHPVIALNMPICQAPDQVSRAVAHNAWLQARYPGVTPKDLDLTPVFSSIRDHFPGDVQDGLTMANTRSRLRMLALYAFAGHHRFLVAGTGNKVEDFGVGFYTKYGDGGVDISPIADLMKSEVYALGRVLGIAQQIITAPPTDGLWEDNRTDEGQIGAGYDELEWAMAHESLPEEKKKTMVLNQRQKQVLSIFRQFHKANRHKMDPIPVCRIPEHLRQ
ncbi:MAG: NAD(+) synthase [Desulfotignum sp.]|nr:NAD(+) synthase [Desulfotignum sp.]MCF8126057.1 NAD(+) synthase [Desulfotignum sp.]